jgi:secretion/DNA translocation related TadE-like protein
VVVTPPTDGRLATVEWCGDARGAATVWALALLMPLLMAGLLGLSVAQVALARQRVGAVADIAAVAGAQAEVDPCGAAASVVAANAVVLSGCVVDGIDVRVEVSAPTPALAQRLFGMLGHGAASVTGSARAGPP